MHPKRAGRNELVLIALGPHTHQLRAVLERSHEIAPATAAMELGRLGLLAVLPAAGLAAAGAIAATFGQTRGLVSAKGLAPQLSRINPMAALKRIFGPEGAIEFLRTLLKLGLVGAALWAVLGDLSQLQALLHQPARSLGRNSQGLP